METYHPTAFLSLGWKHRSLIVRLARRRIQARYRGSLLGSLWTFAQPLLMLAVYTFVFGTVFRSRWEMAAGANAPFALVLFAGMVFYGIFAECVSEAPGLMLAHQTYVKQMRFPIEILPWVSAVTALFGFAVNAALLLVFLIAAQGVPPWTATAAPLLLAPLLLFTLGATWLFSAAGVYLRDLAQIAGVLTTTLLFLSPIFYPADRIPESFRALYALNPFVPVIEGFRGALFEGRLPDPATLALVTAGGWLAAWLGYVGFMKTKKGFADVL